MKRFWLGLAVLAGAFGVVGCGPKYNTVEGVVEYEDGGPVEGATVSFIPADGKGDSAHGLTDASGNFSLKSGKMVGAKTGKYKVVITKVPKMGDTAVEMGSKDMIKMMTKGGAPPGAGTNPMMKGPAPKVNSELGQEYATAEKTPFTTDVPASGQLTFKVKKAAGKK